MTKRQTCGSDSSNEFDCVVFLVSIRKNLKLNFAVIGFDPGRFRVIDHNEFCDNDAVTNSLAFLFQNESEK